MPAREAQRLVTEPRSRGSAEKIVDCLTPRLPVSAVQRTATLLGVSVPRCVVSRPVSARTSCPHRVPRRRLVLTVSTR